MSVEGKKKSHVWVYFDVQDNVAFCTASADCKAKVSLGSVTGNQQANLLRHLKRKHADVHEKVISSVFFGRWIRGHMRCAIHSLQLAIRDGLKATEIQKLLAVVRHIVRKLRTPNLLAVIRRRGGLLPILDMPTRWGSTFLMAKRLLELKDHVQDLAAAASDLLLSDANWRKLEELATTLKMPYDVTVRLQSAAITPGSFLKEWTALKSILNKQESTLAQSIENSMDRREEKLFDNNIFLAAVLLDSRYRILLKDDQVERGKQGLREVIYRLRSRSHCGGSQDTPMLDTSPSSTDEDEFEKELDKMERSRRLSVVASLQTDVDDDITTMLAMGRVKTSPFVAAEAYPNGLKPAAMTLTAMPVSQVSVERLFSGLKFLLSDQRASMKADLVEALLFLRTNTTR